MHNKFPLLEKTFFTVSGGVASAIWKFPRTVEIETTNACNSNCTMCTRDRMTRKIGIMSWELFEKVVNECAKHKVHSVHLHNFGEALLVDDLPDRIKHAKRLGIAEVKIFTNGSLLTGDMAERILNSGLDKLKISFDGIDKNLYETTRRGLSFDEVQRNINEFMEMRQKKHFKKPQVSISCLDLSSDTKAKNKFLHYWRRRVDNVSIGKVHNWGNLRNFKKSPAVRKLPCFRLWSKLTILWNGEVALCCVDYDGQIVLGNVCENTIADVWKGKCLKEIRQFHLRGEFDKVPICKFCSA